MNNFSGVFSLSDSWYSRIVSVRQTPYNSISVVYDNVLINSVIDGSFDCLILFNQNNKNIRTNNNLDIFSNSNGLTGTFFINRKQSDSGKIDIHLTGGNIYGATSVHYTGKSDFLKWNFGADYLTSSGFQTSNSKPSMIESERNNSYFSRLFLNGSIGIGDNKSYLNLSNLYSQGDNGIPLSYDAPNTFYIKEPDSKLFLINLKFGTLINYDISFSGNLFYSRRKNIIEKYDNVNFNSFDLESSYVKTIEESKYGWNSAINYSGGLLPPAIITLNYSREGITFQQDKGLNIQNYSFEKLQIGLKLADTSDWINYSLSTGYKAINPLTLQPEIILGSINNLEYSFNLLFKMSKNIGISGILQRRAMLPQIYSIYKELNLPNLTFSNFESTINNSVEIGLNLDFSINSKLLLNYFSSEFQNIHYPFSINEINTEIIKDNYNSAGIELNWTYSNVIIKNILNLNIIIDSRWYFSDVNNYDPFGREMIIPNFYTNSLINFDFNFGLSLSARLRNIFERTSLSKGNQKLPEINIFDIYFEQKVYNGNSIFFQINNLTDEYYELFTGYSMPGLYFVAGIKLKL